MPLVSDANAYAFLGITSDEDEFAVVPGIRDSVEALLAQQTNQIFGDSAVLVDDIYDGTNYHYIYLRRPILSLQAISFRYLLEITNEPLYTVDITNGVSFRPGTRRLNSRLIKFPYGRDNVLISFTTSANNPAIAITAVQEAVAMVYRTRGSEDARSEQKGTFQHVLLRKMDELRFWNKAIEALNVPTIG